MRPKPMSSIITTYITPLLTMNNFINVMWSNRETQQYTMTNWVVGGTVAGIRPISTYLISMNILLNRTRWKWDARQSTTPTWVMRVIVAGVRPISISTITTNNCSNIGRGRVAGILWPISISSMVTTLITTMINSTVGRWRVAGILRPKFTYSINCRHSKNYITINNIVIAMVWGKISGLSRPIYKTSTTIYIEISCIDVVVACIIVSAFLLYVPVPLLENAFYGFSTGRMCHNCMVLDKKGFLWSCPRLTLLEYVRGEGWIVPGTGICQRQDVNGVR